MVVIGIVVAWLLACMLIVMFFMGATRLDDEFSTEPPSWIPDGR